MDIPEFLRITAEKRKAAWDANPPTPPRPLYEKGDDDDICYRPRRRGRPHNAAPKAATKAKGRRPAPDQKIKLLVTENPHKAGSGRHQRWPLYQDGMTVRPSRPGSITATFTTQRRTATSRSSESIEGRLRKGAGSRCTST
jgi:hypothetical protein